MARPPFRAAVVLRDNAPDLPTVLENRWGGALVSSHPTLADAEQGAARLNAKGA